MAHSLVDLVAWTAFANPSHEIQGPHLPQMDIREPREERVLGDVMKQFHAQAAQLVPPRRLRVALELDPIQAGNGRFVGGRSRGACANSSRRSDDGFIPELDRLRLGFGQNHREAD